MREPAVGCCGGGHAAGEVNVLVRKGGGRGGERRWASRKGKIDAGGASEGCNWRVGWASIDEGHCLRGGLQGWSALGGGSGGSGNRHRG